MKKIIVIFIWSSCHSFAQQNALVSFLTATFGNKNVYKTKAANGVANASAGTVAYPALTCTLTYKDDGCSNSGTIVPANMLGQVYTVSVNGNGQDFIRYKELKIEGDIAYIRFLKGCYFSAPNSIRKTPEGTGDDANDYVFAINTKNIDPAKRYLASSAIIGKLLTIPVKIRQKYWDHDHTELLTGININYAFGWKYKLGNHPYHSHYVNLIPYAVGIGAQNYFDVLEGEFEFANDTRLKTTKAEAQVAITYWCSGLTYEYDRFNIGMFIGWDAMLKPYESWGYNKKMWYGLGIGYDIFK
jgi:hypothetical protein